MAGLRAIFAHNLKKKRRKSGLTQAQLAEKAGVSTHHIAMIEIERHYPTMELVERIASVLGTEIYELFIDPLSPPEEMERLHQTVAKNLEQLISESAERAYHTTAKNLEQVVVGALEKYFNERAYQAAPRP